MRILNREAFLKLPAGTVFAKFGNAEGDPSHFYFGEVCIKEGSCGNDFVVQDLTAQFEGWTGSESHFDELERMSSDATYESPPLGYDSAGRDGLFDVRQRFAVWSLEDTKRLIARLQDALLAQEDPGP
jgi:hypothetical protein